MSLVIMSNETALVNREEGVDDVKSAWLLRLGLHMIQWSVQSEARLRSGANHKNRSKSGLEAATRLHEVGIASNRESDMSR